MRLLIPGMICCLLGYFMVETIWWTFKEVYFELHKSTLDGLNEMKGKDRLEDIWAAIGT